MAKKTVKRKVNLDKLAKGGGYVPKKKEKKKGEKKRASGRNWHSPFDVNEILYIQKLYERGWSINEISKKVDITHETISAMVEKHGWKQFTKVVKENNRPTIEVEVPSSAELSTVMLVQIQNLSRIDYMLATGDLLLQRLRSEADACYRVLLDPVSFGYPAEQEIIDVRS